MSHLILDLANIKHKDLLNNQYKIEYLLKQICQSLKYTILHQYTHTFQPQGLTMFFCLAESHISIHTYPEHDKAYFDLYTCRDGDDLLFIKNRIQDAFDCTFSRCYLLQRS